MRPSHNSVTAHRYRLRFRNDYITRNDRVQSLCAFILIARHVHFFGNLQENASSDRRRFEDRIESSQLHRFARQQIPQSIHRSRRFDDSAQEFGQAGQKIDVGEIPIDD